jgi:hypothetical protein
MFQSKLAAILRAEQLIQQFPGLLTIFRTDGSLDEVRTYPRDTSPQ